MSATLALQKAIYGQLANDAALTSLIGAGNVFDDVPRNSSPPFVRFAGQALNEYAMSDGGAEEHLLELEIWSDSGGRQQIAEIATAARAAIAAVSNLDQPHALVNLEIPDTRFEQVSTSGHYRAVVRVRAVTEEI